jgi:hypothetical protein
LLLPDLAVRGVKVAPAGAVFLNTLDGHFQGVYGYVWLRVPGAKGLPLYLLDFLGVEYTTIGDRVVTQQAFCLAWDHPAALEVRDADILVSRLRLGLRYTQAQ